MTVVCRTPAGISLIVAEREHLAGRIEVEEYYDLPGLKGALTTRAAAGRARPRANLLGEEGHGVQLTRNAFFPSGASIGIFAVAAMRQAFDIAYRFALTETRGGPVLIIEYQAVSDVLADAKGRIEAVRLLSWRALDAVMSMHLSGPELALHAKIFFGSETGVDVINKLIEVAGVTAYDERFPIVRHLLDALSYPVIEGSNVACADGSCRRCSPRRATTRCRPRAWPEHATPPRRRRDRWRRRRRARRAAAPTSRRGGNRGLAERRTGRGRASGGLRPAARRPGGSRGRSVVAEQQRDPEARQLS